MPSRKRSKGKARKAKSTSAIISAANDEHQIGEDKIVIDLFSALSLNGAEYNKIPTLFRCRHGSPSQIPPFSYTLLQRLYTAVDSEVRNIRTADIAAEPFLDKLMGIVADQPPVTSALLAATKLSLLAVGPEHVLNWHKLKMPHHKLVTCYIPAILDRLTKVYTGVGLMSNDDELKLWSSMKDGSVIGQEFIRFYHKQVSCNCLGKMYHEAKKQPKQAVCAGCSGMFERSSLSICQRCKR